MGWTVYWHLLRDRALDAGERKAVAAHVAAQAEVRWPESYDLMLADAPASDGQIAYSWMKIANHHDVDTTRLLTTLGELRELLPTVRFSVSDDLGLVGWDAEAKQWKLGAPADRAGTLMPEGGSTWTKASTLADRSRASYGAGPEELLAALEGTKWDDPERKRLQALLAVLDPGKVALAGISRYDKKLSAGLDLVQNALKQLSELGPVRGPLLGLWRREAPDGYWHEGLVGLFENVAFDPEIAAFFRTELVSEEAEEKGRLESVARVLGLSRSVESARAIAARLRRTRQGQSREQWKKQRLRCDLVESLARLQCRELFSTFVLEIAQYASDYRLPLDRMMKGFILVGGARAWPYLSRILDAGQDAQTIAYDLRFDSFSDPPPGVGSGAAPTSPHQPSASQRAH